MQVKPRLQLDRFLHGGDYNPDQWLHDPQVLAEDLRLMDLARCNIASIGIFAWTALEPADGELRFEWLDDRMDRFAERGWKVALATPSAAVPFWMLHRWPEILRVRPDRRRDLPGDRMKYCLSAPILRERLRMINRELARRYAGHPALMLWHVSNEYIHYDESPGCHCATCRTAFRTWLRKEYSNDLDRLNRAWWTGFWSHTYTDWEEIDSPAPHGDTAMHGLQLAWRRFVTDQTIDFFRNEIDPLRELTPEVPVTTNLMGAYRGLDYWKLAKELDVISWDSYPTWHAPSRIDPDEADAALAEDVAFLHDLNRSLGDGRPFLLMESTPSVTNWQPVAKLKRPGMHLLSSLQAIAHGSDSVMYFQWRKGRGAFEKFHGAVVDHTGHENTRVFRDVAAVGEALEKLRVIAGAGTTAEVAIVYDWQNRWAIEGAAGPRIENKDYHETCLAHYRSFHRLSIAADVISSGTDLSKYRLVVAPMLYMIRPGVAESLEDFVSQGGTLVMTYWSGIANEDDLVFTGGFPGPLRRLLGIWVEEIDALYPADSNHVAIHARDLGMEGVYEARELCEVIHAEGASVLGEYKDDFYAGRPAMTVNRFGKGDAYYLASRNDQRFADELAAAFARRLPLRSVAPGRMPHGVTAQARKKDGKEFVFVMNFTSRPQEVALETGNTIDLLGDTIRGGRLQLTPYGVAVLAPS